MTNPIILTDREICEACARALGCPVPPRQEGYKGPYSDSERIYGVGGIGFLKDARHGLPMLRALRKIDGNSYFELLNDMAHCVDMEGWDDLRAIATELAQAQIAKEARDA